MIYALGLVISTVGSSLAFFMPLGDAFGLIKIAAALIGAALLWMSCAPGRLRRTALDEPLAACAVAFALSWVFSIDQGVGLLGIHGQPFHGLAAILPAVVIFYAVAAKGERFPDLPFYCAAVIAIANGAACAAQLAGLYPAPFDMIQGRLLGLVGSPIFLGSIMVICLPACLWLGRRGGAAGALGIAGGIGGFLALTACGSRGPWIAIGAGVLASLAASGRFRPRLAHLWAAAAVAGLLLAFSGSMGKKDSDSGRVLTWATAARAGAAHPVLGWGPDTFALANRALKSPAMLRASGDFRIQASAHNDLLQAWATTGIVGLLAWLWLWIAIFYALAYEAAWELFLDAIPGERIAPIEGRAAAVVGALAGLFVVAKFNPVPPSAYYIAAALIAATGAGEKALFSRRILWALGVGAIVATSIPVSRSMRAELLQSDGAAALRNQDLKLGADLLRQANETAPYEIDFASPRCELLYKVAPLFPAARKEFAKRALRASGKIAIAHPNDPSSFELMSTTELFAAPIIGDGLARASLKSAKRAVSLDPLVSFSANRWLEASLVVGDRSEAVKAQALVERIKFLVENR